MRDTTKEYEKRNAQPLVVFTHHGFEVGPLIRAPLDVPVLLDPASTMSATYGVAFQLQFREGTLPWSARAATFIIDRDGVLRHADDYEDRTPLWTPLRLLDDLKQQRSLIESMKTTDRRFVEAADLALAPLGPNTKSSVPVLVGALGDRRSSIRAGAAAALYWIASAATEAAPSLARSLDDEDARVRRLAGLALGRMGKAAEPHLLKALKHKDASVRVSAAWDLSRDASLTSTAVGPLIDALADENMYVRLAVVRSLVRLPMDLRTTHSVLDALATALTDRTEPVRHDAGYGLSEMGPRARLAIPLVARALRHPDERARRWGEIVWSSLAPYAKEALIKLLTDESSRVRTRAATSLGELGPKARDAVGALIKLLGDKDQETRMAAARSLKKIDPEAARKAGVR